MKENMFIRRPAMAISIAVVIVIIGTISLLTLPVEQYPDIAPPTIRVSATYTGADAEAVMQSVIVPLEESINGVENMIYMTSNAANDGTATISVFFKQGTDPDVAAMNVQNRVQAAQGLLPEEVTRVGVTTAKRQTGNIQIVTVMCDNGRYDESFIANWLDINLFPQIKRVEGVGAVNSQTDNYSMRIWLKPDVMAQYRLAPDDVTAALEQQNMVASAGSLGDRSRNTFQYAMKYRGRLKDIREFENIVIRSGADGNVLRLKDIAEVELGSLSYSRETFINGNPGVNFTIHPMPGVNTTEVNRKIMALYEEVEKTMPEGIRLVVFLNSNEFLFASIYSVIETLLFAVLLVVLVMYFFLRDFRSTLIPTISIFVSVIGTFAVLQLAGISLNLLTLFALVLSIGTVVDDAIIVIEAVQTHFEAGSPSSYSATRKAMGDITVAIVSCSLVFMAVFIPVAFMGGTSGIFYAQFGITMATAVGISCVVSLTLVPAMSVLMLRPAGPRNGAGRISDMVHRAYNASYKSLFEKYRHAIVFVFRRRWIVWSSLGVSLLLFAYFILTTHTGLVPQEDKGLIYISVGTSPGNTLDKTAGIMQRIEDVVKRQPEVEIISRIGGRGALQTDVGSCYGTFYIRLKDWSMRPGWEHSIDAVIARLNAELAHIAEADVFILQEAMIPGYGSGNAVELHLQDRTGGDVNTLYDATLQFLDALRIRPEIGTAFCSFALDFPQYLVEVDAAKSLRAGIAPDEVMRTMGAYYGGSYVSNFNQFGKIYRVMMQTAPESRLDEQSLSEVYVRNGGRMAPLSQFVTLKKVNGSEFLTRFNLYSSIGVSVSPSPGYSNSQAMAAVSEVAAQTLPAGYSYEYGGISREEAQNSGTGTALIYLLCVVLIYFILVSLYESFFVPFAVILSVPSGLMGSFLFARMYGLENNIYLQIGVIMLIGLLSKTAILITEYASERRRQGMSIAGAAFSAAKERFRPILMTVLAMIVGLLPLMLASGVGAVGNRSLGTGAVGGMLVGTVALLFMVPAFFIVFRTLHEKFVRQPEGGEAQE